jgi:porin
VIAAVAHLKMTNNRNKNRNKENNMKQTKIKVLAAVLLAYSVFNCRLVSAEQLSLFENPQSGVEFGASVTNIYQRNIKGGLSTSSRKGEYSGKYDLELELDFETLLDLQGNFFIHLEGGWTSSEGIDEHSIGSYMGVNANAIGNRSADIVEAFYQFEPFEGLTFSAGKFDLTGFFDGNAFANDEGEQFINDGLVNNPSIPFPDYGLGVATTFNFAQNWYISAAAADAQADGRTTGFRTAFHDEDYFFFIAETGFNNSLQSKNGLLEGNYRFGIWNDPQPKKNEDSARYYRDDLGLYLSFDQMLYRPQEAQNGQGLGLFARFGLCDGKRNDLNKFYSCGLQYKGIFAGREQDVVGIGYANGGFTSRASGAFPERREQIVEMFYKCKLTENVDIAPDLQYISSPGASGTKDSIAAGIRLRISL